MPENELKITIDMDRSQAAAQSAKFRQDQAKLNADLLSDANAMEAAKLKTARDAQGRFVAGSRATTEQIKEDHRQQASAATTAFGQIAGAGKSFFQNQAVQHTLAQAGWAKLTEMVGAYGKAVTDAQEKRQRMVSEFTAQREDLGQLANLMGRTADDAFTVDIARFGKAAGGMRPSEARSFLESFYNAGAQHKGVRISGEEFGQLAEQSGRLSLARGVDPGMVADLAAKQLGFKDYKKFGAGASEQVLGDVNQALAILSSGGGSEGQLGTEVGKLSAAGLSEDKLRGAFTSIKDVAKMVSVLTEGAPEGQAEMGAATLRAIRGFDKAQGKFLGAAGVTPSDDPFAAVKKIGDYAAKQAAAGPAGTTIQDIIRSGIPDELGARGLNILYNKGVSGGLFEARDLVAGEAAGPGPALGQMAGYARSKRGLSREADADLILAERERGMRTADLDIIRRQTVAAMTRSGELDATGKVTQDYLVGAASFGLLGDATKRRIDQQVWQTLQRRTPRGVLPPDEDELIADPALVEEKLQGRISALEGLGLDPYHDMVRAQVMGPAAIARERFGWEPAPGQGAAPVAGWGPGAGGGEVPGLLREVVGAIRDGAKKPAQAPPVRPMVGPPRVDRR